MSSTEAEIDYDVHDVPVDEVDLSAARANLDSLARRFLGMSGEEFLALRARGQLSDRYGEPGYSRVAAVASLMD